MAIMLEQLNPQPGHRVLEIGAGTGYNAALMGHLVGDSGLVITVDIDDDLVESAREHLGSAGLHRVSVVCGDGGLGYADRAPYDRIILTVGAWDIVPAWWKQLKLGGRLLLPLEVKGGVQKSVAFDRMDDDYTPIANMQGRAPIDASLNDDVTQVFKLGINQRLVCVTARKSRKFDHLLLPRLYRCTCAG